MYPIPAPHYRADVSQMRPGSAPWRRIDKLETVDTMQAIVSQDGAPLSAVTAKWYFARRADGMAPLHCVVWIYQRDRATVVTYGNAPGVGYHKPSAALDDALARAGVALYTTAAYARDHRAPDAVGKPAYIHGAGDTATRHALAAVARAVTGRRKVWIL